MMRRYRGRHRAGLFSLRVADIEQQLLDEQVARRATAYVGQLAGIGVAGLMEISAAPLTRIDAPR
jgi:hypothetical protein